MKLKENYYEMDVSGAFEEAEFGIDDEGIIFEILRSKMYPNAIKACVQEIMSNGRDANREVGHAHIPIDVQLPTAMSPQFYVRDYGPGISPERMVNVFIKYGNSTKRKDNLQTGGFGLGAKTPWAYTDQFTIITYIPDDQGKMIKRMYVAVIDGKDKIGKLYTVNKGEVVEGEKQGTMISVLCKPGDEYKFADWVRHTGLFWNHKDVVDSVRPNVINGDFDWPEHSAMLDGDGWFCKKHHTYNYGKVDPLAVIDGIQYKLSWDHLDLQSYDVKTREIFGNLFRQHIFVFFKTGELSVAANREEIDYDKESIAFTCQKFCDIAEQVHDLISNQIKDAKNLWDANILWNSVRNNFQSIVKEVTWTDATGKEHKVTGKSPNFSGQGIKIWHYSRSYRNNSTFRKGTNVYQTLSIDDKSVFVVNDEKCKHPNRRRLNTIFADEDIQTVSVVQWPDDPIKRAESEKKLKDMNVDLYAPKNISTFAKADVQRSATGGNAGVSIPKIWEFTCNTSNNKEAWDYSDTDNEMIEDGEGVYVLLYRRNATFATNGRSVDLVALKTLVQNAGVVLYGVAVKSEKDLGPKWVPFETKIKEVIDGLVADPALKHSQLIKYNQYSEHGFATETMPNFWKSVKDSFEKRLLHSDGSLYKYLAATKLYEAGKKDTVRLRELSHNYNIFFDDLVVATANKVVDGKEMKDEVNDSYPLMKKLDTRYDTLQDDSLDDFYDYINAKDAQAKINAHKTEWDDDNESDNINESDELLEIAA